MRKKICILLIAACLSFIWINSFFPADISSGLSGTAEKILRAIFGENIPITEGILRKMAHGAEYAAFGAVMSVFLYEKITKKLSLIGFCGLGTAVLDETIQLFSDGRSSQVKDIWIDFSGFTAGVIFILIIKVLFDYLKGKNRQL